jgi:hypothetical protein
MNVVQLETIGNGHVITMDVTDSTFGADRDARVANIGKVVSLKAAGAAKMIEAEEGILGRLVNVNPKGDLGGVCISGFQRVPYTGTAPVPGAIDGTGHVIGSATDGVVKRCSGTWTAAEAAVGPKLVESVRTADTTCVIHMGNHSMA